MAYEARVLEWLGPLSLPVPQVVAVDPDGAESGLPTLVMKALAGGPAGDLGNPADWMPGLAATSARLSALDPPDWIRPFGRYQRIEAARPPVWAEDSDLWFRAIAAAREREPPHEQVLLHRDYHPWNVLWSDGISGVVDWSQTSVGPPAIDATHCRANLAIAFDADTADEYRGMWERCTGRTLAPYWDVVTCLDFLPDWRPSPPGNANLEGWLRRVLAEISDGG